jgi:putative hydrolase
MSPVDTLKRIAFLLESRLEPGYRVRSFRRAAALEAIPETELRALATSGSLQQVPGVGDVIERIVLEVLQDGTSAYLERLETAEASASEAARPLLAALRGDCHTHSDWSDGLNSIEEMALTAKALGREYIVLTDHSPRLTVAHGLSPERLREQLQVLEELNERLAPFRILTGIEVDILEDGSLDQEDELLAELDVVVGSAHSLLRMESDLMTQRMLKAIANPHLDILGHCTGRLITRRGRPESTFDAEAVFRACQRFDKAVEINSRPERLDPPERLLALALETGCRFAIDSDAHAPGQLEWLRLGCEHAAPSGLAPERVVNTLTADDLIAWTHTH